MAGDTDIGSGIISKGSKSVDEVNADSFTPLLDSEALYTAKLGTRAENEA